MVVIRFLASHLTTTIFFILVLLISLVQFFHLLYSSVMCECAYGIGTRWVLAWRFSSVFLLFHFCHLDCAHHTHSLSLYLRTYFFSSMFALHFRHTASKDFTFEHLHVAINLNWYAQNVCCAATEICCFNFLLAMTWSGWRFVLLPSVSSLSECVVCVCVYVCGIRVII